MSVISELKEGRFAIGVIHVPPFPTSLKQNRWSTEEIIHYAVEGARILEQAGFSSVLIQNVGDEPTHLDAPPETIANMSVVGAMVKRAVSIPLGICLLDHDGCAPIAVAAATGAQYVRIKTYVGTMSKMTGTLQGVYHQAVRYRRNIRAENVAILADIFDREGVPVGASDPGEMAHFAEYCCMADGLILTGHSQSDTEEMLRAVRGRVSLPLLVGGGVNAGNVGEFANTAQGFIVGNCLKTDPDDDFSPLSPQRCGSLIEGLRPGR